MSTQIYYRPIAQIDRLRPDSAVPLAGGWSWFEHVERLERGQKAVRVPVSDIPKDILERLTSKRSSICGLTMDAPCIMGILNATPDSFSDGGQHHTFDDAMNCAREMVSDGADIVDIGGESTRPGADYIEPAVEIDRTVPVIEALQASGFETPISIDTRKASVAQAALNAGATLFNDVSALGFDPNSLGVAADSGAAICLMHAQGLPESMQDNPNYDDVLLDVYDFLADRIAQCEQAGIDRSRLIVDPGIGFGKTMPHNLALIRGMSLFHGLGCAILLGVSRKGFIGVIANEQNAADRTAGSIAIGLEGLRQGVQFLRVHDIKETKQAVTLMLTAM